ncbi:MAG: YfjI family protein [Candidatus Electronema sp. V4]|uniref:YfjI family protein n=1 Tax=Candidatus Electronema sp. V4 TaxID=3454756 RepID=UPI004055636B
MSVNISQFLEFMKLHPLPEQVPGGQVPEKRRSSPETCLHEPGEMLDVPAYCQQHGVEIAKIETGNGGQTKYILAQCVFDPSHTGKDAAIFQDADGKLGYKCFHNSCSGYGWKEARAKISGDVPLSSGGSRRNAASAAKEEQPDSPLPLIKKNELSEPFPFHVLGPLMEAACRDIQQAVQAPDALIAQCVLASANLAVQPLRDMLIDGRGFPLSLFLLTIAATGERKSAVDQVVLKPHREAEYQADKDMDSLCALYEMELAAWEKEKSVLINDGKRTAEEKQFALEQLQRRKPKKPLDQKRLVSDFTFEGMYKLFQAGVPSKGLFADEGGQVTGGHGMRQETILATAAGLSKFWDGGTVDRIRVMDGASSLRGRRLAVHLMMQDKVGLDFFSNPILRDQGLGSRMLAAWPTSTAGGRAYSAVNALETAGVRRLHERIEALLAQPMPYREDSNKQELQPPAMTLSREAKQAWVEFYNQVEAETGPKQTLEPVRGLANKAAEHAARIAGTVQLFENLAAVAVEEWAMQCGIKAAAWYLNEALRICGASNPAAHLLDAEKVLRWIHENGLKRVILPDMYQYSPVRSAGAARKAVETLKNHNHLLEPVAAGGRKPAAACRNGKNSREWWEVHPESNSSSL